MDTLDAIYQRRSIKHYDPEHRFSDGELNQLLNAAIQSPTSFNMQNWRFVLVQDPELRKEIRAAAVDQAQVTDASLLFVLTADVKAWQKDPARYWQNAPAEVNELLVENPQLINEDPYGEGWMFRLQAMEVTELDQLLTAEAYQQLCDDS